ncbi:MAG: phosphatidylglycerol lysyltransferase domain-containing protein [Actinomycetota bacterium]|nr:phosphatidylglycerol lysyltransferase domain-containing protein [Actinomycetota bacterium]
MSVNPGRADQVEVPVGASTERAAIAAPRRAAMWRWLRRAPASLTMIVVLWTVGGVTGSLLRGPSGSVARWVGASVPNLSSGHLIMLVSSALFASNLANYLLATVMLLVVGAVVERRLGTGRTVVLAVVIQTAALLVGLLFVHVIDPIDENWNDSLSAGIAVTPLPACVGLLLAHSARQSALWRRRVRLLGFSVLLTLSMYGGYLEDSLALSGALVGFLVGVLLWRRSTVGPVHRSSRRETRSLVGAIVAVTSIGPLLVSLSPSAVGPLRVLRYVFTSPAATGPQLRQICAVRANRGLCAELISQNRFHGLGPSVFALLPAVLVLVLARGLTRGRLSAWWMAMLTHLVLLGLGLALALSALAPHGHRFGGLALLELRGTTGLLLPILSPLVVVLVLAGSRSSFRVQPPPGTHRRLLRTMLWTTAAAFGIYTVMGMLLAEQFTPRPTWLSLTSSFPLRLIPPGYLGFALPRMIPHSWIATAVMEWPGLLVWAVALIWVLLSFRRVQPADGRDDAQRARDILSHCGGSALSYLTMWAGNAYWFNQSNTTFIAYRVYGGIALTTTDPVGPVQDHGSAIIEFAVFCDSQHLVPCLYSITARTRSVTAELGWKDVQVAEETVLELGTLAFTGRKFQDIRTAINRATRTGITAQWMSYSAAPVTITSQVLALSEEWVADKGLPEMGFTLGGIEELIDPQVRCLIAVGDDGVVHGITSWLPVYRNDVVIGRTLDFMRRPRDGVPGIMEFLIGTAALDLQQQGAEFISLSGAPLARNAPSDQNSALQNLLDQLSRMLEPVYGFKSLLNFKAKFQPTYLPVYMSYPDPAALPRIAVAIAHAYVPELTLNQLLRTAGKL